MSITANTADTRSPSSWTSSKSDQTIQTTELRSCQNTNTAPNAVQLEEGLTLFILLWYCRLPQSSPWTTGILYLEGDPSYRTSTAQCRFFSMPSRRMSDFRRRSAKRTVSHAHRIFFPFPGFVPDRRRLLAQRFPILRELKQNTARWNTAEKEET